MPFTAEDLMEGRPEPVCASGQVPVEQALELMIENDFSQLPIVDDLWHPTGLITSDGILRGLSNFGVTIDKLRVWDVSEPVRTYSVDDSIFDLLEGLRNQPAVLITDSEDLLVGIVTSFDTTAYFRRRAEDMMLVDDIETMLVEHITAAFTDKRTGELDENSLQTAIDEVSNAQVYKSAREAISRYAKKIDGHKFNSGWANEACVPLLSVDKKLSDLTLYQYTELLLHKSIWSDYKANFGIEDKAIRHLLDGVRDTRNALAHFRSEVRKAQRDQLRFCLQWFEQHPANLSERDTTTDVPEQAYADHENELEPLEEEPPEKDSRYAKLALYLQEQPSHVDRLRLSFEEIEAIIGHSLPPSSSHRSWWANDSVSHVQSLQWLDAGWIVASVNVSAEQVTFTRGKERGRAYIDFFSELLVDFRERAEYPVRDASPIGTSWINVMGLPTVGRQTAIFAFSFTHGKRFRVELYIDTVDQEETKQVFDTLYGQRGEIEREVGTELAWERLNNKRASRVALYTAGSITDGKQELVQLRVWAVEAMTRLQRAMLERADDVLRALQ